MKMDLKQDNWYDLFGRNMAGYEQIRARIDFLEREYKGLGEVERNYEIEIVKRLVELIPNEASRKIWQKQINGKLERIFHN